MLVFTTSVFTFPALDSGMFYDGNHTYLIEPDENYTSDVSRTYSSPAVFFEYSCPWVQGRPKAMGPKGHPLIPNSLTSNVRLHFHGQKQSSKS